MLTSVLCEAVRAFHPDQHGCREKHSSVDAVAVGIAQTQGLAAGQGRGSPVNGLCSNIP